MSGPTMKGLLLAGGHGTRLRPLTFTGNKHMVPIANEPMLFYGLRHLADAGIHDVAIILGPIREGIPEVVGDGSAFGLRVTYITQGEPKGLAHAVLCAREFLGDDPFVMYLGDNLLQDGARPLVERYRTAPSDAVIGVTPVQSPSSYGVVELEGERIVSIVEKPPNPRSNLALIGVYLFTPKIHDIIRDLKPSARGELEITEAIWQLHKQGGHLEVQRVSGWWKDTGRPSDLLEANDLVLRTRPPTYFRLDGEVAPGAELKGHVALGRGSSVAAGASIEGPVVIGSGVRIEAGSRIGPATAIGDHCVIGGSSVRNAIIMKSTVIEGPFEVVSSIVGQFARLRAKESRGVRLSCVLGDSSQIEV
jgi:glucose-1-phosphate thymidylyltransferase